MTSNKILAMKIARFVSPKFLQLIILPTEACNFRCTYCYEDFAHGRMPDPVINGIKQLLARRIPELDQLHLSWFGGEPLLAKDVVIHISDHVRSVVSTAGNCAYSASMTTNGSLLTAAAMCQLVSRGVTDFQISLDGPRDTHDRARVRKGSRSGTFDSIWSNLRDIKATDEAFIITLRVHFDGNTVQELDPLIDDLRKEFLDDKRFRIFFKSIARLGGPNDDAIAIISKEREGSLLQSLYCQVPASAAVDQSDSYVCYASRANSFVIRADGRIGKCTVALRDDRNDIGHLCEDGTVRVDSNGLAPWIRGLQSLDPQDLECPLHGMPTAQHQKVTFLSGSINARNPAV